MSSLHPAHPRQSRKFQIEGGGVDEDAAWSAEGSTAGFTIDTGTGMITGVMPVQGDVYPIVRIYYHTVTVTVRNTDRFGRPIPCIMGRVLDSIDYLPVGYVGRPCSHSLNVIGPDGRELSDWTVITTSILPAGLILDQATGVLSGSITRDDA